MAYILNQELCSACHRCRTECPMNAIRFRGAKYWIDPDKCIACGKCAKVCHNGCITDPNKPAEAVASHERLLKSCDVCVIGGGGAGLIAANKAQDLGCSVIVLEKMHEVGGSSWYAGGFRIHWCQFSEKLGLTDTRDEKYQEFMTMVEHRVNPKLLARMFKANEQFADWLIDEHGILNDYRVTTGRMGPGPEVTKFEALHPWKDAAKRIDRMIGPGEIGSYMAEHMQEEFLRGGGELLLKTSACKLLTDDAGAVCGVLARDSGGEIEIRCKAVVVASGAFSRNKELMNRFQPMFYDNEGKEPIHVFTGAGCTGDGITMCGELGADIDYINRRVNMFGPMRHPYPCASMAIFQCPDGFQTGSDGKPFSGSFHTEISTLTQDPRWFGWKYVDDAICETAMAEAMQEPPQSLDMDLPAFQKNWRAILAEEAEDGAVVMADTLEELAEKLDIDTALLKQQVEDYNTSTLHPAPLPPDLPDFMRPKHDPMPLTKAPFYAIKMKMFHENAIGGMTIDENASVLKNGVPITGLYAAGDTTRGIMVSGDVCVDYLEGVFSSLTMAYNEGYIAGTEAGSFARRS